MPAFSEFRTCRLLAWSIFLLAGSGCGGAAKSAPAASQTTAPTIRAAPALNGAVVVTLSSTTSGATIYYTTDGTTPNPSSQLYQAPFLVASNLTVDAMAVAGGHANSSVASQSFSPNIPSGTLVWSDEFNNATGANAEPNPAVWTYDTGADGWGNHELEDYCSWNSSISPCTPSAPNAYAGKDGYLHVVAKQPSAGVYTSARMKTEGLFSFQYGRVEFRAKVPEAQGLWPNLYLMGNTIANLGWPKCGEMDVLERVGAAKLPDWNKGQVHGPGYSDDNDSLGTDYKYPAGQTAAGWHTYGMIWSKGSVAYYVDTPQHPYVTYTVSSIRGLSDAVWPFDSGNSFILLHLAVGGDWPGKPSVSTHFPSEMLVDYVRIYTN